MSSIGGYFEYPWLPNQDQRKWYTRWPSVVHVVSLLTYIAVITTSLPSYLLNIDKLGSTERTTIVVTIFAALVCPWMLFLYMQTRLGRCWQVIQQVSEIGVALSRPKLRKYSLSLVLVCLIAMTISACVPLADMITYGGSNFEGAVIALILATCHASLLLLVPPMQVVFLAGVIRESLKKINSDVSIMCGQLCSLESDKGRVKLGLQDLSRKLRRTIEAVRTVTEFYGVPIAFMCLIYFVSITGNLFYIILIGFGGRVVASAAMTSLQVICNVLLVAAFTIVLGSIPEEANTAMQDLIAVLTIDKTHDCKAEVMGLLKTMSGPPVQITAANFFAINRGLFTSIAGAVTTYLIVLAQFKGAETEGSSLSASDLATT